MFNKTKTFTVDKIADTYLARLLKLEKKKKRTEFLNEILDKQNVYYDQEIIDKTIEKLTDKGLVTNIFGVSKFSYAANEPAKGKTKNVPLTEILTTDFIKNLEGSVGLYELTNKGRNFVLSNQVIDEDGRKLRLEQREKWFDRIFGFVAGIIATLLTTWLLKYL
jgi:hypothetical protein